MHAFACASLHTPGSHIANQLSKGGAGDTSSRKRGGPGVAPHPAGKKQKQAHTQHQRAQQQARKKTPCAEFVRTGSCKRGRTCAFAHDPASVDICKFYVRGHCRLGLQCPLSHDTSRTDRMPVCRDFLKGLCVNAHCKFRHVKVNSKATVCAKFLVGKCTDGDLCSFKHERVSGSGARPDAGGAGPGAGGRGLSASSARKQTTERPTTAAPVAPLQQQLLPPPERAPGPVRRRSSIASDLSEDDTAAAIYVKFDDAMAPPCPPTPLGGRGVG